MKNILVAMVLTVILDAGLRYILNYRLNTFLFLLTYFLVYGLVVWVQSSLPDDDGEDDAPPDRSEWPISGPFMRLGKKTGSVFLWIVFWTTNLMCLLNPFQFKQIVRQITGNSKLEKKLKESGKNISDYKTEATYHLPFQGKWLVYNGGITRATSHSWDILGQRFAIDFVQADDNFSRHSGNGIRLDDYYCYGKKILSASDGVVIAIENSIPDAPLVGFGFCDFFARSFIGNHVIIQHAREEYGIYAHLIKGSITIQPGEEVKRGEVIGKCGHSGHSSEPHLHFHLQDSPDFFNGLGLPVTFSSLQIDGVFVSESHIEAVQWVQNNSEQNAGQS